MTNPLLAEFDLPPFQAIEAQHFLPAVEQILKEAESSIESLILLNEEPGWGNFLYQLETIGDRIERIWAPISNLNAVRNTPEIRQAYSDCLPLLTDYSTKIGQHEGLFRAIKHLRDSDGFHQLEPAQKKMVDNMLRDFKLSGIDLSDDKKQRYSEIKSELAELTTAFSNNVLDATQAWKKVVSDLDDLAGMPEDAIAAAAALAKQQNESGYMFTLDIPSYLPVMQYCENRTLREEMYHAYVTRASELGPNAGEFDNQDNIERILLLRQELAAILGFDNYAELSLATKMAGSAEDVIAFLTGLANKTVEKAREEYRHLCSFAAKKLGIEELKPCDVSFATERLRKDAFDISQEELKPYFAVENVIQGMFEIVRRLYDIRIDAATAPSTWHKDVRFFELRDADGNLQAQFFLDLFAREEKRGGAWMADCQNRRMLGLESSVQTPVAFLTCNFTPPSGDKPALLTHNEVTTLFHEFGHGLHHMLTEVNVAAVAGISGVAWDAVELPSQFMENWCWEEEALSLFARHYESDAPLPRDLLDKMLKARNFQSAMQMVRQLEFSIFDFLIHRDSGQQDFAGVRETLQAVRANVAAYDAPEFNRFENSFSHIFAGGYAAGYYSYKWAEVLSADAFSLFEEKGIFDRSTGQRFKQCILAKGGSEEPAELFADFRGRAASNDALLRHNGIGG